MVSTTKLNPKKKRRREDDKKKKKQYQHQTINVDVNSSGNDSTTRKQHQPNQMQLPLSVYDSSLVSPHYGINDRQPTNPLVDAEICGQDGRATASVRGDGGLIPTGGALVVWPCDFGPNQFGWLINQLGKP